MSRIKQENRLEHIRELNEQLASRDAEVAELKAEVEEESALRERLAKLLAKTAIALKGEEAALTKHSWHDLGWCAAEVVYERDKLRNQVTAMRDFIKQQGEVTDTCTFNILKEVCNDCACHRATTEHHDRS